MISEKNKDNFNMQIKIAPLYINLLIVMLFLGIKSTLALAFTPTFDPPLSPRIANYDMDIKLDAETKIIDGREILTWRNASMDTINELQFHLYLNAFKNSRSTFMKESARNGFRGMDLSEVKEEDWGYMEVLSIVQADTIDLTAGMKYIQPDDNNEEDQTVLSVPLNSPVYPNDTIVLDIRFQSKLPKLMARAGYNRDYHFVVQWFPKIGVYESAGQRYAEKGQWNCHQFHSSTEFFANFGVYDVKIRVPDNMVVGASGVLQEETKHEDGTKTVYYRAEDVIDFAWTAFPGFEEFNEEWEHVKIRLLIPPEHSDHAERYLHTVKKSLEYFDEHVGKYPYPTVTIVDPPIYGIRSCCMEYPTLFTGGSIAGLPMGWNFIEGITAHEFGHQYFMQMVANNEFEEAWLDEGFNTYWESRALDATYGDKTSFFNYLGLGIGNKESNRVRYVGMSNPKIAEVFRNGWDFKHGGYGALAYGKTATWLVMLENLVGLEVMDEIMRTYFERWKFKHPCGQDFIDIVNEIVPQHHGDHFGADMNWFFDEVLYGSDICDYKVASIRNTEEVPVVGLFDENGEKVFAKYPEKDEETTEESSVNYQSEVIIHRLGEMQMPVEVLIHFEDGTEVEEYWDGKGRTHAFEYNKPEKIIWAKVDPAYKIYMDVNFNNNSYTTEPDYTPAKKYTFKFFFWLQNAMQFVAGIF